MLGDTAIAVHPSDKRYQHLHGKYVIHPFQNRRIPIVADEYPDPEFGTGAVKITPAHDPNDFIVGQRQKVEFINIFTDDGKINENGAPFTGLQRFDARVAVLEALKEKGLYVDTVDNKMVIPICTRSQNIVEPLMKPQWWVNCTEMAGQAVQAVRSGEIEIVPAGSEKEWFSWLETPQDWCISRQLWWGHRVPAYFVMIKGDANDRNISERWVSGRSEEEARENALKKFSDVSPDSIALEQDEDVLDTWFSSGLWPFATLGWPEKTKDMELFFPNSLLETGWDILFFWVARMVMMSLKLTGQVPFKKVFCHAMVRDAHGRKMSKSLGNVIDPIDVIEGITLENLQNRLKTGNLDPAEVQKAMNGQAKDFPNGIPECGTDALRFTLLAYSAFGRDINLDILRVDGYKKFCNKIWNATRFALLKLDNGFRPFETAKLTGKESLADLGILNKLNNAIVETNQYLEQMNFMQATNTVYQFWWTELCDVYLVLLFNVGSHQTSH
jgi:valyl-tRNA synthetase